MKKSILITYIITLSIALNVSHNLQAMKTTASPITASQQNKIVEQIADKAVKLAEVEEELNNKSYLGIKRLDKI